MINLIRLVYVTATLLVANPAMATIVLYEDFETPDTINFTTYFSGETMTTATNVWSITANSVDLYEGPARAEAGVFDGTQAVDLTGSPDEGVMQTPFTTQPGETYELVFHYARNNFTNLASAEVDVIGASSLLQQTVQHDSSQYTFSQYQTFSDTFVADDVQALLRFTSLNSGLAGVTIDAITITQLTGTLSGDLNCDGFVGLADLDIVLQNWNQNVPQADPRADVSGPGGTPDGFIGLDDLDVVLNNWNAGTPPASVAVPEPTGLTLLGLGSVAMLRRR